MGKRLVIVLEDRTESFGLEEADPVKEATYWIRRRIEKENNYAKEAYIVRDEDVIDVPAILSAIEIQAERYREQLEKEEELRLLKKLKEKYEG